MINRDKSNSYAETERGHIAFIDPSSKRSGNKGDISIISVREGDLTPINSLFNDPTLISAVQAQSTGLSKKMDGI